MPAPITQTSAAVSWVRGEYEGSLAVAAHTELVLGDAMRSPKQRLFQCLPDRRHYGGFGRKASAGFLRDLRAIDPHAEFTAATGLESGFELQFLRDERRHTGGAR